MKRPASDIDAGQYLMLTLGDYPFALGIAYINKVQDISGQDFALVEKVVDLYQFFNIQGDSGEESYLIRVTDGEREAALFVDRVVGIKDFQLAIRMPFPAILADAGNNCIRNLFFDGLQMISELDAHELLRMAWGCENQDNGES